MVVLSNKSTKGMSMIDKFSAIETSVKLEPLRSDIKKARDERMRRR